MDPMGKDEAPLIFKPSRSIYSDSSKNIEMKKDVATQQACRCDLHSSFKPETWKLHHLGSFHPRCLTSKVMSAWPPNLTKMVSGFPIHFGALKMSGLSRAENHLRLTLLPSFFFVKKLGHGGESQAAHRSRRTSPCARRKLQPITFRLGTGSFGGRLRIASGWVDGWWLHGGRQFRH